MLNEDILDAVKKNLPAVAATELAKYIEQAEANKKLIGSSLKKCDELTLVNGQQHSELTALRALDLREDDLDERERNLKVVLAEAKVLEAEKRCDVMYHLISVVFKNPVVRQNLNGSMPIAGTKDQYGSLLPHQTASFTQISETEVEGTK